MKAEDLVIFVITSFSGSERTLTDYHRFSVGLFRRLSSSEINIDQAGTVVVAAYTPSTYRPFACVVTGRRSSSLLSIYSLYDRLFTFYTTTECVVQQPQ